MRFTALAVAALMLGAPTLATAAADVKVTIGPELAARTKVVSQRDLQYLSERLEQNVSRALAAGPLHDATVRLTLIDAKPNRPTQTQISLTPGLSMESIGIGGAAIEGELILADGTRRAIDYDWFSVNLADVGAATTWTDADRAFRRFARQLSEGRL